MFFVTGKNVILRRQIRMQLIGIEKHPKQQALCTPNSIPLANNTALRALPQPDAAGRNQVLTLQLTLEAETEGSISLPPQPAIGAHHDPHIQYTPLQHILAPITSPLKTQWLLYAPKALTLKSTSFCP
jgi:hypothetical protein